MSATLVFPCGHSYRLDNIISITNLRCATCAREAHAKRAAATRKPVDPPVEKNLSGYAGRMNWPLLGHDKSTASLPEACGNLLKAIYREHPYVFAAAEKAGRQVVRP